MAKKYESPEALLAARQENARRLNEIRALRKQQSGQTNTSSNSNTNSKMTEQNTPGDNSSNEDVSHEVFRDGLIPEGFREVEEGEILPAGDYKTHMNMSGDKKTYTNAPKATKPAAATPAASNAEVTAIPIANIETIGPFAGQTKYEEHVTGESSGQSGQTTPPKIDKKEIAPGVTVNPEDDKSKPPIIDGKVPSDQTPGDGSAQPIDNPPKPKVSEGAAREQCEEAFDELVNAFNYSVREHLPIITYIKPKRRIKAFKELPPPIKENIVGIFNNHNVKNQEKLCLNDNDIAKLKPPTVAVMMESSEQLSNMTLLKIAVVQVLVSKAKAVVEMVEANKQLVVDINTGIQAGVSGMTKAYNDAKDILHAIEQKEKNINELIANVQVRESNLEKEKQRFEMLKNNGHEKVIPETPVTPGGDTTIAAIDDVLQAQAT